MFFNKHLSKLKKWLNIKEEHVFKISISAKLIHAIVVEQKNLVTRQSYERPLIYPAVPSFTLSMSYQAQLVVTQIRGTVMSIYRAMFIVFKVSKVFSSLVLQFER